MSTKDNTEFQNAIREIAIHAPLLQNPYDRVRCTEWARRLAELPDDNLESAKLRNHYIQLLRIQVRNHFLHGTFLLPPPGDNAPLCSLPERLGIGVRHLVPGLPRAGPLMPMLRHSSPDGRAFIAAQQVPSGGVLCYMAVSPTGFKV